MVLVVQMHLLTLAGNLGDTVVVSPVQLLHLAHQIVALHPQAVEDPLDITAVVVVSVVLPLKMVNLVHELLNLRVAVVELLLESLSHAHLALEVLGHVLVVAHVAVTLALKNSQLGHHLSAPSVDVRNFQLGVLVLIFDTVQL